jgi:hypothetical protein
VLGLGWHGRCNKSCEPNEKLANQPNPLGDFIMLTLKDLPQAQELDSRAMSAVSGGHRGHAYAYGKYENSGVMVKGDVSGVIQNGGSGNVAINDSFNDAFDKNKGTITFNF